MAENVDLKAEVIEMGSQSNEVVKCHQCGKEITVEERYSFETEDGSEVYFCSECMEQINKSIEEETKNPNIAGAIMLGVLAGLIGGIVWFAATTLTNTSFGILAIGLGWVIAVAVCKGAGNKKGKLLQLISAGLTTLFLLLSEYLIFLYFLYTEVLQKNGVTILQTLLGGFLGIGDFIGDFISYSVSPVGLVIWAVGIYTAYIVPKATKI